MLVIFLTTSTTRIELPNFSLRVLILDCKCVTNISLEAMMIRTIFNIVVIQYAINPQYIISRVHGQIFNVDSYKTQVFIEKITPNKLSWNDAERENDFHYVITSAEGPDLPSWIFTKYVQKNNNSLYVFGSPPIDEEINSLEVQISVTSLHSYRIKFYKLNISIHNLTVYAKHEVRIKINNINIEDMLEEDRQKEFLDIFRDNFWTESKDNLHITYLVESQYVGFRQPINPNNTTGVVIQLGSTSNFSVQLYDLQNETKPLAKHCPSFSKRITVERYFRPKNFIIDWCYFKLMNLDNCQFITDHNAYQNCISVMDNNAMKAVLRDDTEDLIHKDNIPVSTVFGMLILLVIIPSMFFGFFISSWLASFMCIHNEKLNDPYSDDYFETILFVCEDVDRTDSEQEPTTYEYHEPE